MHTYAIRYYLDHTYNKYWYCFIFSVHTVCSLSTLSITDPPRLSDLKKKEMYRERKKNFWRNLQKTSVNYLKLVKTSAKYRGGKHLGE